MAALLLQHGVQQLDAVLTTVHLRFGRAIGGFFPLQNSNQILNFSEVANYAPVDYRIIINYCYYMYRMEFNRDNKRSSPTQQVNVCG